MKTLPDTAQADSVRTLLASYGNEAWHREQNRVRLAIMKLGEGDLDALHGAVAVAKRDYVDVIAWAEYPEQMQSPRPSGHDVIERDRKQYLQWLHSDDVGPLTE